MSDFLIRAARAGDEDAILALLLAFAKFEKLEHKFRLTRETIARDFLGPHRRVECDVAETDHAVCGVIVWYRNYATFSAAPGFYVEDIYVDPGYRGHGIGTGFIKHLARQATGEGVSLIYWNVLDWNREAIAFYDRLGAKKLEGWVPYLLAGDALQSAARK